MSTAETVTKTVTLEWRTDTPYAPTAEVHVRGRVVGDVAEDFRGQGPNRWRGVANDGETVVRGASSAHVAARRVAQYATGPTTPTDPRAALVEHMAKRIRWAMHTGDYANATVVAEEFAAKFERVLADGSAER